ncbi:MAG: acyltransferase family protein [Phycisphaerales bacterium JB052]
MLKPVALKPGYRPDIDGLRAVAVLAVLFFHAELGFPGGFVGVDIFFVISGYLITRLIVSALERGTFTYTDFWTRRLKRIWPAASAMVITSLIAGFFLLGPGNYHELATDAIPQALMLANVQFARGVDYFHSSMDRRILLHTWSLAVEEQFYLFYPFLIVCLWRHRRRLMMPCLIFIALLSLLTSVLTIDAYPEATFFLLHARAWELLLGGILSQLRVQAPASRVYTGSLIMLAVPLTLAPMCFYDRSTQFPGIAAIPPCLGTAMLIHLGTNPRNFVTRFLAWEPLRRIGLISYSLYLVHWPILAFMRNFEFPSEPTLSSRFFAFAISFPIAYISWRFIEQPFRKSTPKSHPFLNAVIRSAVVSGIIIFASLGIRMTDGADSRFNGQILAHIKPEQIPHHWQTRTTSSSDINSLTKPIGRINEPTNPIQPSFLFWGDSHAMALCEFIDEQSKSLGISGLARIRNGTTPIPGLWSYTSGKDASQANLRILEWLVDSQIKHVILCSRWSIQVDG